MTLPIDMDLLKKREEIPVKLAELSYKDQNQAVIFMRKWGERKVPISELHEALTTHLRELKGGGNYGSDDNGRNECMDKAT